MTLPSQSEIRALIVDDEPLAREVLRHMLNEHPGVTLLEDCANGREALKSIKKNEPDVVFLDVQMPGIDGLELAHNLEGKVQTALVFVTAHSDYAVQAFERNAIDYLLKPFDHERFNQTMNRVRTRFEQEANADVIHRIQTAFSELSSPPGTKSPSPAAAEVEPLDRITVKESGRIFFLSPHEVHYLEATGNYVALHVDGKTHLVHETLGRMEQKLDPKRFIRIHRSTIVNMTAIQELQPHFNGEYVIILKDKTRLKSSRTYSSQVKARLGLGST